jgi:two-component system phosphate regulon sensor histidine kinase PhoR
MLKRIYTLIIAVLVIAVLTTGLVAIQVISSFIDRDNRNTLLSAARLIQQDMDSGLTAAEASQRTMQIFSQANAAIRVTVVDRLGKVLFDNEAEPGQMDNHLFRPEISFALQNKSIGSAVRQSSTLAEKMLYIALYDQAKDIVIRTAISLEASQAGLNNILLTILIVMGCSLVLLTLIGAFSTRLITRPLINLKKAAQSMAAGQYNVRVHNLRSNDGEITALSMAFNSMADRLQTVVGDLEDKNARLDVIFNSMTDPLLVVSPATAVTFMNTPAREIFGRDLDPAKSVFPLYLITHREETDQLVGKALTVGKPIAAECAIQTDRGLITFYVMASPIKSSAFEGVILTFHDVSEARKIAKMRSEFVANVTHELRTPLTSIRGFIETLRRGAMNNPDVAGRFLEIIDIEAERLHKLISDILILSEIEDLHEDKDFENFDLNALIDDVAVLLDETASARKISIIAESGETPLPVNANRYRIKQILINLADNAIKYNYEGGKVFIRAERRPDGLVRLTVRDTGAGIPREHQDRIFERFYRVDTSRSRELGGTGLGLSIVKHIAQLYGGTAKVTSQPGEGAIFTVDLDI